MKIFYYFLFLFFIIAILSGKTFGHPDEEPDDEPDEDDVEGRPAGGAPWDSGDIPGGVPNVHSYGSGKK